MFIDNVQSVEDRKRRVSSVLDSLKHLDAKIDELAEALICENGRSAVSSSNTVSGTEVLEQLVKQIGGEVVLTEQCVVDSEIAVFARVFSFPEEPS